jgi:hypothetical protein
MGILINYMLGLIISFDVIISSYEVVVVGLEFGEVVVGVMDTVGDNSTHQADDGVYNTDRKGVYSLYYCIDNYMTLFHSSLNIGTTGLEDLQSIHHEKTI